MDPSKQLGDYGAPELSRPYYAKIVIEGFPYTYNLERIDSLVKDEEGFVKSYMLGKNYYAFFTDNMTAQSCIRRIDGMVIDYHRLRSSYAQNLKTRGRMDGDPEGFYDQSGAEGGGYQQSYGRRNYQEMEGGGGKPYPYAPKDNEQYYGAGGNTTGQRPARVGNPAGYYNNNNNSVGGSGGRPYQGRYTHRGPGGQGAINSNNYNAPEGLSGYPPQGQGMGQGQGSPEGRYQPGQYQRNYDPMRSRDTPQYNMGGRMRNYEGERPISVSSNQGGYGQQGNQSGSYQLDQGPVSHKSPIDYGNQPSGNRGGYQQPDQGNSWENTSNAGGSDNGW